MIEIADTNRTATQPKIQTESNLQTRKITTQFSSTQKCIFVFVCFFIFVLELHNLCIIWWRSCSLNPHFPCLFDFFFALRSAIFIETNFIYFDYVFVFAFFSMLASLLSVCYSIEWLCLFIFISFP